MRCTTQVFNGHMQSEDEILDGGIAQAPIIFTMDGRAPVLLRRSFSRGNAYCLVGAKPQNAKADFLNWI